MRDLQRLREFQRQWMRRRRSEWIAANGPCAQCGSPDRLEADHRDRESKRFTASAIWSMSRRNPNRVAELAKLQVLCFSCHKAKTRSEFIKPLVHGTYNAYKKKACRCDQCRAWNAQRARIWNARASSVRQTIGSMPSQDRPEVRDIFLLANAELAPMDACLSKSANEV
jgi:hypothetical protein